MTRTLRHSIAVSASLVAAALGLANLPDGEPETIAYLKSGPPPSLTEDALHCAPGQARALTLAEPSPSYVNGPRSARTPQDAIDQRIRWLGDAFWGDELTWQQVGPSREDNRPMTWARWAGLRQDGKLRAVFTLQGGRPGGGWLVTGTLICTDVPEGSRPY